MSPQSFSQLITVNLQYNSIEVKRQCSEVNCVKSIHITINYPSTSKVKKIANKQNILHRIQVSSKEECFITLKDHKLNFENNATSRLTNPAKNEIGRISKVILRNINKELKNKLQLQQYNNTTAVIK